MIIRLFFRSEEKYLKGLCALGPMNHFLNSTSPHTHNCWSNIVLCVFSVILVFAEYCRHLIYWAIATLIFIMVPNILINIFSLRWLAMDQKTSVKHWITHCFLLGLMERYLNSFYTLQFRFPTLFYTNLLLSPEIYLFLIGCNIIYSSGLMVFILVKDLVITYPV